MKGPRALVSVDELLMLAARVAQADRYLTLNEVAELTGFSKRSLQKAHDLPRYRPFDGAVRFRLSEVHRWMQRHAEAIESGQQDAFVSKIRSAIGAK